MLWRTIFPKQFTVGVLSSLLRGVRLFPGSGVRLSRCVRIHLSPSLAGGVRLFEYFHLSPNSFVQSGWWCPTLRISVFSCLPSFVSQSGWWCAALWMFVFTCLPSFVPGLWCPALWISVFTCLPSCVSQPGWCCQALWMSVFTCLPPFVSLHLSPSICLPPFVSLSAGGVRLSRSVFTCLPSFVSQSGWWCPRLRMSLFTLYWSHLIFLPVCLGCPALRMSFLCFDLSAFVVVSGSFACSPLCIFHHLSLTFCLVLHLSPRPFVSNHMSALVALSCSSFIIF